MNLITCCIETRLSFFAFFCPKTRGVIKDSKAAMVAQAEELIKEYAAIDAVAEDILSDKHHVSDS